MNRLELIAAVFSPFGADGELALDAVNRQVDRLVNDGVDGAFVCGTTGEGSSLDTSERKRLAAYWREKAAGKLKVMVHVGHTSLREAADLAAHAQSIGADAVAAVVPYFLKPSNADDAVACLQHIARAAPNIGLYYYHIPMLTNFDVPASEIVVRAQQRIPNFAGVKFTDDNLSELARVHHQLSAQGKVYFGRDDLLLKALQIGVRGAVGMSYNFSGKYFHRMFDAYTREREIEAEDMQGDVSNLLKLAMPYGLTNVLKAISVLAGVDCGPSRMPLKTIHLLELDSIMKDRAMKAAVERLMS